MATGSTFDSNITRDDLITLAFQEVNEIGVDEVLEPATLAWGIKRLNIILRRLDAEKQHIWTVSATPATLTLVADTFVYTSSNGLPTNIKRLVTVNYRDAQGRDYPLKIYTPEEFSKIEEKTTLGTPQGVLLSEHITVGSQTLYVYPTLTSVNTQSEVTGSDSNNYRCIRSHTSDTDRDKPITGDNYLIYWELGGSSGSAWADATAYTAPQHLRFWYERPLFDFTSSTDNPDVPQEWVEVLLYEMVEAITNQGALSVDDRVYYTRKTEKSRKKIQPAQVHKTNDLHNKVTFF
jgi:hypothetical protein